MRVLVLTHNYPRFPGDPAGAFVRRIAVGEVARGHEVTVVAPHAPGLAIAMDDEGVALRRFRYAPDALETVAYRGTMHHATAAPRRVVGLPLFLLAFWRAIRRAVATTRPDVIHAHWWLPSAWLASGTGIPLVVTVHGSDVRLLDRSSLLRRLAQRVMRRAATITTVSDFLANDLRSRLPSLAERVHTVAMPVDVDNFARGKQTPKTIPPRILYAGNLLDSKGVDILIRAFATLRQAGVPSGLKSSAKGQRRRPFIDLHLSLGSATMCIGRISCPKTQCRRNMARVRLRYFRLEGMRRDSA